MMASGERPSDFYAARARSLFAVRPGLRLYLSRMVARPSTVFSLVFRFRGGLVTKSAGEPGCGRDCLFGGSYTFFRASGARG